MKGDTAVQDITKKKRTLGDEFRDYVAGRIDDKSRGDQSYIGKVEMPDDPITESKITEMQVNYGSDGKTITSITPKVDNSQNPFYINIKMNPFEMSKKLSEEQVQKLDYMTTHDYVPKESELEQYNNISQASSDFKNENKYGNSTYKELKESLEKSEDEREKKWLKSRMQEVASSKELQEEYDSLTSEWNNLYDSIDIKSEKFNPNANQDTVRERMAEIEKRKESLPQLIENKKSEEKKKAEYDDVVNNNVKVKTLLQMYYDIQHMDKPEQITDTYSQANGNMTAPKYSDEEVQRINALYQSYKDNGFDMDTLYKYYSRDLDKKRNAAIVNSIKEEAKEHPVLSSVSSVFANTFGSVFDASRYVGAWLDKAFGGDGYIDPNSTNVAQARAIREGVSEKIDNPIGSFFYGAGMSITDNLARMPLLAVPGGKALSLSLASTRAGVSAANDVINSGGSIDNAFMTAVAAGAAEAVFEKIPLDNLIKLKNEGVNSVKGAVSAVFKQMAVEGTEEAFTDIANAFTDRIINGDMSQLAQRYNAYLEQGLSESEAWGKTASDFAFELAQDFGAGALSGGVMSGTTLGVQKAVQSIGNRSNSRALGNEAMASEDFDINKLIADGENSNNKKAVSLANGIKKVVQEKGADKVKAVDVGNLLKLINSNELNFAAENEEVTASESNDNSNYKSNDNDTSVDISAPGTVPSSKDTGAFGKSNPHGINMKTRSGERLVIMGIKSVEKDFNAHDSNVILFTNDGRLVNADDVYSSRSDINNLLNYAKNFDTNGAQVLMSQYEEYCDNCKRFGKEPDYAEYARSFDRLYSLGRMGVKFESIQKGGNYANDIKTLGFVASVAVSSGNRDTKGSLANIKNTQKIRVPGSTGSINSRMYVEKGSEGSVKASDEQLAMLQAVAEKSGRDVILTDKIGEIGGNENANGVFKDGKIYIRADLNENYMLSVALHEATHGIRIDNPAEYQALCSFVTNYLAAKGENIDFLIDDIKSKWGGSLTTQEDAVEELVCQTVMAIAADEAAIKTALSLEENKGILKKVASALKKIAKAAYDFMKGIGTSAHNLQAQAWLDDTKALQQLAVKLEAALESTRQIVEQNAQAEESGETGQKNNTQKGVKLSAEDNIVKAEFEKNVDAIEKNIYNSNNVVIMGVTPDVLQKIGLAPLPLAMTQNHIYSIAVSNARAKKEGRYRKNTNYHDLGFDTVKDIYDKISNPLMIIAHPDFTNKVSRNSTHKIIVLVDLSIENKQVIAPVSVDYEGMYNNSHIDVNLIATYFDKNNINDLIKEAVALENNNQTGFFYIDKKRTQNIFKRAGYQLPRQLINSSSNIIIRKIDDNVNKKINKITQSQQFIRWFGDWQNHPETASKVVDSNGEPLVVYHQTKADFTVFNTDNERAGLYDSDTPIGMFFKTTDKNIGLAGNKQMAVYLNAKNVLTFNNRDDIHSYWMKNVDGYSELQKQYDTVDKRYQAEYEKEEVKSDEWYDEHYDDLVSGKITDEEAQKIMDGKLDDILDEWKKATNPIRRKQKNLITEYIRKSDVDGIHIKNDEKVDTYIVFKPTQIKSATDNIGTFDGNNPDIRYAVDDEITDGYFADGDLFDDEGYIEPSIFEKAVKDNPDFALSAVYNRAAKTAETAIKKSKIVKLDDKSYTKIANKLMSDYGISEKLNNGFREELAETVKRHTKKIENSADFAGELELIVEDCRDALLLSGDIIDELKEERESILGYLKGKTLVVTDFAESEVASTYESINRYRKRMFGKVNVGLERNNPKGRTIYMDDIIAFVDEQFPQLITDECDSLQGFKWLDNLLNNVLKPRIENRYTDGINSYYENIDTAAIEMAFDMTTEIINQKAKQTVSGGNTVSGLIKAMAAERKKAQLEREAMLKAKNESYRQKYLHERELRMKHIEKLREKLNKQENMNRDDKLKAASKIEYLQKQLDKKTIILNMGYESIREQYNEGRTKTVYMEKLGRMLDRMTKKLDGKANNNEYIPEVLKKPILDVLSSFTADPGEYKNGHKKSLPGYFGEWKNIAQIGDRIKELTSAYASLEQKDKVKNKDYSFIDINSLAFDKGTLKILEYLGESLKDKNIYDLSSNDLIDIYDTMKELDESLRRAVEIIIDGQKTSIYEAASRAITETEGLKYKKDVNKFNNTAINVIAGTGREIKNRFLATSLDPTRYGRLLSGYHDDYVTAKIFRELHDGDKEHIKIMQDCFVRVQAVTAKYSKSEIKGLQRADVAEFDIKDMKTGKRVKLSQGILLAIYLTDRQADGHRHLVNDRFNNYTVIPDLDMMNLGRDGMSKLHKVRFSEADLRNIKKYVQNNKMLSELAGAISEVYNTVLSQRINEVSMAKYGKLIATVKNYYPLQIYKDGAEFEKNFDAEFNDVRLRSRSFTKQRETSYDPIVINDVLKTFTNSVQSVSEYCGLLIPIENFKKVYNSGNGEITLHEAIKDKFGESALHYVEKLMADLQQPPDILDKTWLQKRQGDYMGAKLLLNPGAALKQFAAFPTAFNYFGVKNVCEAAAIGMAKIDFDLYAKYTPYLWYRKNGNGTVVGELSKEMGFYKKSLDKVDIMGKLDRYVVGTLLYAAEQNVKQTTNLKYGTEEFYKEVAKRYEKCLDETQPNNMITSKPQFIRNNVMKLLSLNAFRSQNMAIANCIIDSFAEFDARRAEYKANKTEASKKARNEAAKKFAGSLIGAVTSSALIGILTVIANMIIWHKYDDFKDEEGKITKDTVLNKFFEYSSESMAGCFAWGDFAYNSISKMINNDAFYGLQVMSVENINNIAEKIVKGDALGSASLLLDCFGIPAENGLRILRSITSYGNDIINGNGEIISKNNTFGEINTDYFHFIIVEAKQKGENDKAEHFETLWKDELIKKGKTAEQANDLIKSKLITALSASDDDIEKAALAKANGDLSAYENSINKVVGYGFDSVDVKKAVDKVIKNVSADLEKRGLEDKQDIIADLKLQGFNDKGAEYVFKAFESSKASESTEQVSVFDDTSEGKGVAYTYSDAFEYLKKGDTENYKRVEQYLIDEAGKKKSDIQSSMRSAARTDSLWKEYFEVTNSGDSQRLNELVGMLTNIYGSWNTAVTYGRKYKKRQAEKEKENQKNK